MSTTKTTATVKKPVAKPVAKAAKKEEVKVTEVKVTETPVVKEEKAPAKKAPAKKAAAKTTKTATKTAAKTTTKKSAAKISVQFADKTYTTEDFEKIAKDVWVYDYAKKATELKEVELYVKPEECKVYYVFNGDVTGSFDI